jgi:hypothetical protein
MNLNTRNPTIKRIMKEMKEMAQENSWQIAAKPLTVSEFFCKIREISKFFFCQLGLFQYLIDFFLG